MKNSLSALCILLSLLSCADEKKQQVTQLQDKKGLMYKANQAEPFTGTFTEYSVYGQEHKRAEKSFKDGKRDGVSILWNKNGEKSSQAYYKSGKQHGVETVWYLNGQKGSVGNYKDGKRNGLWTEWYTNGLKWKEGDYIDGKRDGIWTEWGEDGKSSKTKTYKNGTVIKS